MTTSRRVTAFCTLGAAGIALLVLLSWLFDRWQLLTFGSDYVPMAPSTAWLMLLLGSAVFLRSRWSASRMAVVFCALVVSVTTAFSLLMLLKASVPIARIVDDWLSGSPLMRSGLNAGRMSLIAAYTFLAAALAVAMELPPFCRGQWFRHLAALLAFGVVVASVAMITGYVMGQPILYQAGFIPMALVTAVAFVLLGTGIMFMAGADTWPLRMLMREPAPHGLSFRLGWMLGTVLIAMISAIAYIGFVHLNRLDAEAHAGAENELRAVADMKINQIVEWRKGRLKEGSSLFNRSHFANRVRERLANPSRGDVPLEISSWLTQATYRDYYEEVALLDPQLNVRFSAPSSAAVIDAADRQLAQEALRLKQVILSDLYRCKAAGDIQFALAVPVLIRDLAARGMAAEPLFPLAAGQPPVGVVLFQIKASRSFFPLIQSWPIPSQTAEILLVRRDGDDVLYLNELRHQKGTALELRISANAKKLPAAKAVRGEVGVVEGVDYRFAPVLAAIGPVPGTPWFMVAKVDLQEVYAPLRRQAKTVASSMGLLIMASCLVIALIWRRRDTQLLRHQLKGERQQQAMAQRVEHLMKSANDIIIIADEQWNILEANDRAVEVYGYSLDELRRMRLPDLRAAESRAEFPRQAERLLAQGRAFYETVTQRKDGSTLPLEVSVRIVEIGGVRYYLGIARDLSQRKQAEAALRQQTEDLRARNEELERFNKAGVGRELRMIELKQEVNQLCQQAGLPPRYSLSVTGETEKAGDETKGT